ncbi:penicillin-binding transpeptidase domain-containing protein [Halothiobacillus sp. 15-55-196]|jgi:cell division protein FtsI (penicillin-binding protein 3)|uniref:peptidoglycan D,D-transpeptidase FtsI family protein n=1 Tax=Halothiobacillus sp. 15-55-196 TaxID=1970382 RepID=UPI0025C191C3|nr:penicillin-binding transpeptidase domain-containing protein [Halothiobacillus sp. 15-55-196]
MSRVIHPANQRRPAPMEKGALWRFLDWFGGCWRTVIVLGLFGVLALILVGRAVQLQVSEQGFYVQQGGDRQQRLQVIPAHRGMITDRNGDPLAISVPMAAVWVNPTELTRFYAARNTASARKYVDQDPIKTLASLLKIPDASLRSLVADNRSKQFIYVQRQVRPSVAAAIRAARLPGVGLQREYQRFYPTGDVTASLVGFTNIDDHGQAGLEASYNNYLAGVAGRRLILKDAYGHEVDDLGVQKEAQPGHDLVLSIDKRLQYLTYSELARGVAAHQAEYGSAVLMNVVTGEVLAMATVPSFNPNNRATMQPALTRNRALVDQFEPGSSMKPFTIIAALESGRWQPDSTVNTAPGWVRIGGYTIRDHRNYGVLDLRGILEKSSNVGASHIGEDLGAEVLWKNMRAFGFGQETGVGFPGEVAGRLENWRQWSVSGTAAHSYGYGLSVTTLQLAAAYAALANHGRYIHPSLLKRDAPPSYVQVAPAKDCDEVVSMLQAVVSPEGTAPKARIAGFQIAGKTGTSRMIGPDGTYSKDNYNTVFAGIAPASDPRLVLVVVVTDPQQGSYYAGDVAAPIFHGIMSGALRMLNIRPDNLPNEPAQVTTAAVPPSSATASGKKRAGGA